MFKRDRYDAQGKFDDSVAKLKAFRKIGDTFVFLDTMFTVTGHSKFDGYMSNYPALVCLYKDGNGKIQEISFDMRDVEAIRKNYR